MVEVTPEMREKAALIAEDICEVIGKHDCAPSSFIALMSTLVSASLRGGTSLQDFTMDVESCWKSMQEYVDADLQG